MSDAARPRTSSLLRLAWPLIISFTARSLLTSIDIPYGSRLGDAAVAAIGLVFPLEFCFIACWVGVSAALTSHLSRAMGEGHAGRLEQLLRAARVLVVALAVLFLGVAFGVWALADDLGLPPDVAANLAVYGPTLLVGASLVGFWSIVPDSLVKAHHDTKSTMIAGLLTGLVNLVLNTVFVFVFAWGIFGIGLATGLGRLGGLVYALWRAARLERARRAEWAQAPPSSREPGPAPSRAGSKANELTPAGLFARPISALLVLGVPSALTFGLMALEGGVVNWILARFPETTAAIAAYAIYHRAVLLFMMPIVATGVAILPFVARALGEGRRDEVARGLRQAFALSYGYALVVAVPACVLTAEPLAGFLGNRPETVALAAFAIRWATPVGVLAAIPFVLARPAFEAVQRGLPGLVMAVARYVVGSVPLGLLGATLAEDWGRSPFVGLLAGLIGGTALISAVFAVWLVRMVRGLRT